MLDTGPIQGGGILLLNTSGGLFKRIKGTAVSGSSSLGMVVFPLMICKSRFSEKLHSLINLFLKKKYQVAQETLGELFFLSSHGLYLMNRLDRKLINL